MWRAVLILIQSNYILERLYVPNKSMNLNFGFAVIRIFWSSDPHQRTSRKVMLILDVEWWAVSTEYTLYSLEVSRQRTAWPARRDTAHLSLFIQSLYLSSFYSFGLLTRVKQKDDISKRHFTVEVYSYDISFNRLREISRLMYKNIRVLTVKCQNQRGLIKGVNKAILDLIRCVADEFC